MGMNLSKMSLKFTRDLHIFHKEHHDHCTICGKPFENNDRTHLGYNENRDFVYTCDGCSNNLSETVIRYNFSERGYSVPNETTILWRYIDFGKFVSMLLTKSLYFTKVSKFNDPFEGAIGIMDNKSSYDKSMIFALVVAQLTALENNNSPLPLSKEITDKALKIVDDLEQGTISDEDKEIVDNAQKLSSELETHRSEKRDMIYVNCWHENEFESDAMWTLYSKDITNALAIKTTYQRLYESLDRDPLIDMGRVNYINFNKAFSSNNLTQWYKRKSFSHENEVRAVLINEARRELNGAPIDVDLDILIDSIYISPYAGNWFVDIVKDVLIKYKLDKPVFQSDMAKKPLY
jgi:hypothetical protein